MCLPDKPFVNGKLGPWFWLCTKHFLHFFMYQNVCKKSKNILVVFESKHFKSE